MHASWNISQSRPSPYPFDASDLLFAGSDEWCFVTGMSACHKYVLKSVDQFAPAWKQSLRIQPWLIYLRALDGVCDRLGQYMLLNGQCIQVIWLQDSDWLTLHKSCDLFNSFPCVRKIIHTGSQQWILLKALCMSSLKQAVETPVSSETLCIGVQTKSDYVIRWTVQVHKQSLNALKPSTPKLAPQQTCQLPCKILLVTLPH